MVVLTNFELSNDRERERKKTVYSKNKMTVILNLIEKTKMHDDVSIQLAYVYFQLNENAINIKSME